MRTRKTWCVGVLLLASLLFGTAAIDGQPLPPPADQIKDPLVPRLEIPSLPTGAVPAPQPQNIDQILNGIAEVRAKKAELEKQEQALLKSLKDRVKEQNERMIKMGISLSDPLPKPEEKKAPLDGIPFIEAPREPVKK